MAGIGEETKTKALDISEAEGVEVATTGNVKDKFVHEKVEETVTESDIEAVSETEVQEVSVAEDVETDEAMDVSDLTIVKDEEEQLQVSGVKVNLKDCEEKQIETEDCRKEIAVDKEAEVVYNSTKAEDEISTDNEAKVIDSDIKINVDSAKVADISEVVMDIKTHSEEQAVNIFETNMEEVENSSGGDKWDSRKAESGKTEVESIQAISDSECYIATESAELDEAKEMESLEERNYDLVNQRATIISSNETDEEQSVRDQQLCFEFSSSLDDSDTTISENTLYFRAVSEDNILIKKLPQIPHYMLFPSLSDPQKPSQSVTFPPFLKIQLISPRETVSDLSSTSLEQSPEETVQNVDADISGSSNNSITNVRSEQYGWSYRVSPNTANQSNQVLTEAQLGDAEFQNGDTNTTSNLRDNVVAKIL